jgi:hypothetical protein
MLRKVTSLVAVAAFLVMPSGAAHATSDLFLPYVVYPTGARPGTVATGDVNGDGRDDVVVASRGDGNIEVFLQNDSAGLDGSTEYSSGEEHSSLGWGSVDIGDLNDDGNEDVLVAVKDGVGVFLQNQAGSLDPMLRYPSNHSSNTNVHKLRIGDFNSDGLRDVVSIDWGTHAHNADVDVFLQNASGTLDPAVTYQLARGWYDDLDVGDVNGDGLQDIVVMSGELSAYNNIGVLLQRSDGTLGTATYYDFEGYGLSPGFAVGDVSGDALQDIVVSYGGRVPDSFVATLLQNAAGTLQSPVAYSSYDIPGPVDIGDFDLDGRGDVVVAHGGVFGVQGHAVGIYLGLEDGTLADEELYDVPYGWRPRELAIGDMNGDGANDLAVADFRHGLVILYHTPPDCLFEDDQGNDTRLLIWGENWGFTGPGGFEASGTGAQRHGDRVIVAGRSGDVVVSGEGLCPAGPGRFRAVQLEPPRAKFHLADSG